MSGRKRTENYRRTGNKTRCHRSRRSRLLLHGFPQGYGKALRTALPSYRSPIHRQLHHHAVGFENFSYAGQRIALACISDKLFDRQFPALAERYADSGIFGPTFIASILYMITSGCTASTQYGYAEMLNRSVDGTIDFVADTCVYAERASKMKKIFTDNGFHIVYDRDVTQPVGDGFFSPSATAT